MVSDPRYIELISKLRRLRVDAGLSQAELGNRIGRTQAFVSKVETCERRLDALEFLLVCRALGATLDRVVPSELSDVVAKADV